MLKKDQSTTGALATLRRFEACIRSLSEVPAPAAAGGTVGAAPAATGSTAGCLGPAAAGGGPAEAAGVCSIVGLFMLDAAPCSNNKP